MKAALVAGVAVVVVFALAARPARAAVYRAVELPAPGGVRNLDVVHASGAMAAGTTYGNPFRAIAWDLTSQSYRDLTGDLASAYGRGIGGGQMAGAGRTAPGQSDHALVWDLATGARTDLHPAWSTTSHANDTDGVEQVGVADNLPVFWRGTAASAVGLIPAGFTNGVATSNDGGRQVGYAWIRSGFTGQELGQSYRAILWSGTGASAVNLHPDPTLQTYSRSIANEISGGEQVGYTHFGPWEDFVQHAAVWQGTAQSFVDLHPAGFFDSSAEGTNGDVQAGWVVPTPFVRRAVVWDGTADSMVDLHAFLPAGYTQSWAGAVTEDGRVIGTAIDADGFAHVYVWTVVPEPAGLVALGTVGLPCLLVRRPKRPHGSYS